MLSMQYLEFVFEFAVLSTMHTCAHVLSPSLPFYEEQAGYRAEKTPNQLKEPRPGCRI